MSCAAQCFTILMLPPGGAGALAGGPLPGRACSNFFGIRCWRATAGRGADCQELRGTGD